MHAGLEYDGVLVMDDRTTDELAGSSMAVNESTHEAWAAPNPASMAYAYEQGVEDCEDVRIDSDSEADGKQVRASDSSTECQLQVQHLLEVKHRAVSSFLTLPATLVESCVGEAGEGRTSVRVRMRCSQHLLVRPVKPRKECLFQNSCKSFFPQQALNLIFEYAEHRGLDVLAKLAPPATRTFKKSVFALCERLQRISLTSSVQVHCQPRHVV